MANRVWLCDPRTRTATLQRREAKVRGAGDRHACWDCIAAVKRELARRGGKHGNL